jgi:CBS domain-containing protein
MTEARAYRVADLMTPISNYPTLYSDATVEMALRMLQRRPQEAANFGFRRILVLDRESQKIRGVISIPLLLKSMEPNLLKRSPGVTAEGYWATRDSTTHPALEIFWSGVFNNGGSDLLNRTIGDFAKLPERLLTAEMALSEALIQLLTYETPMLPVVEGERVIAVLRLVDLFKLVTDRVLGEVHE